ncbi:hypothetical protein TD95_001989 [Thielaviopsis punctulata]|uniref:XPG-I domain-containing protein n=1 Tax=Thielaviopsis punctulata TaxID=72032 RepID=A0A0F4ZA93_9PEZI|nr:hypothetical protein TD95_001989 [Thielaviopsis punctulata]
MDHLEKTGRRLRIAVDIAIWMFQLRSAKGGSNSDTRGLFYRIVRNLSLGIEPVFVFDGPNKPKVKRNKSSVRSEGAKAAMAQAKQIIRMFGLKFHDAPGEAEAECALMQQRGVVDVVLSEDIDTLMFGCTKTIRYVPYSNKRGQHTHVTLFDSDVIRQDHGLDREGMILVAMMSGGDYDPKGIENCGVKVASEAARAGFGKSLCALKSSQKEDLRKWREQLQHELYTNEKRLFRQVHKTLKIPIDFPNMEILRYYTHPVVSDLSVIDQLKNTPELDWAKPIDIVRMRDLVRDFFDWDYLGGACKLIKVISPCILVEKLLAMSRDSSRDLLDVNEREQREKRIVRNIKSRRHHESTDCTPELRIEYNPFEVVGLDISKEEDGVVAATRGGLATNSDDEFEIYSEVQTVAVLNMTTTVLGWVPEVIVRLGAPLATEDFGEVMRRKEAIKSRTASFQRTRSGRGDDMAQSTLTEWASPKKNKSPAKPQRTISAISVPSNGQKSPDLVPLDLWEVSSTGKVLFPSATAQVPSSLPKPTANTKSSQPRLPPKPTKKNPLQAMQKSPRRPAKVDTEFWNMPIPEIPDLPRLRQEPRAKTPEQAAPRPMVRAQTTPVFIDLSSDPGSALLQAPSPSAETAQSNQTQSSSVLSVKRGPSRALSSEAGLSRLSENSHKKRAINLPTSRQANIDLCFSSSPPSPQAQPPPRLQRPVSLLTSKSKRTSIVVLSDDDAENQGEGDSSFLLPLEHIPKAASLSKRQ